MMEKIFRLCERLRNKFIVYLYHFRNNKIPLSTKVYGRFSYIGYLEHLSLGASVSINQGVHLNLSSQIVIGENTHLSAFVQIHTSKLSHDLKYHKRQPVFIGRNCWIAGGVVVSPGVEIQDNVVVGANSVVISNLSRAGFYAGTPAKLIRLFDEG